MPDPDPAQPRDGAPSLPRRVCVIGVCGAGKSTFAARLARLLDATHIELDALHWEPDWTEATPEAFRARVARAATAERWVADGNYSRVRPILWPHADTIIWLDLPFTLTFRRLLARSIRRARTREPLWSGNRESFRQTFLSRNSVLYWAIKTHRRRGREYAALFANPPHERPALVRLRTPRECEAYLRAIHEASHPRWPVIASIG